MCAVSRSVWDPLSPTPTAGHFRSLTNLGNIIPAKNVTELDIYSLILEGPVSLRDINYSVIICTTFALFFCSDAKQMLKRKAEFGVCLITRCFPKILNQNFALLS